MKRPRSNNALWCCPPALAALLALSACATPRDVTRAGPPAPAIARQTGVLDIQVFRDDTVIRMTNTTARPLIPGRMWINNWFSRPFPGLGVGETLVLPLDQFRDQFGDAFRAGGFFAARNPDTVVLAQLETADELWGLVVVGERTY